MPTLLFVTPVIPSPSGGGSAMHAWAMLRSLRRHFEASVLIIERYATPGASALDLSMERVGWGDAAAVDSAFDGRTFDAVYILRLDTWAVAPAIARRGETCWLDLDECESALHRRLAALHRLRDDGPSALAADAAADAYARLEAAAFDAFDAVFVVSDLEAGKVAPGRARIVVTPNVMTELPALLPARGGAGVTVGFIGTLGYAPNVDAVQWFVREILPQVQVRILRPVRFVLAGVSWVDALDTVASRPDVQVMGYVQDAADFYRACDAVVIPERAGGGTRIKALEAFAYGQPVVSTRLGVEGLDVADQVHLLTADSASDFAKRVVEVLEQPALALALRLAARSFVVRRHTQATLDAAIDAFLPETTLKVEARLDR
jgi:glycosyltransferase involved in cell wall biosynthesis